MSQTGSLAYSRDYGNSWTPIQQGIDLSLGYYRWQSPADMGPVILSITDGALRYTTDTVVLSKLIEPVVGFSCEDSFYLHWNTFPGAQAYRIYAMGTKYLEAVQLTTDTMAVLANANFPGNYVAVEPVFDGLAGQRSYTFNHATQGAGCYIRSFRGELENQVARLYLTLGTVYQVQRIVLEKWNGVEFQPIAERLASDSLEFLFEDQRVVNGVNRYRVRVDITGNRKVYSPTEDLFFTGTEGYRLYPNLVRRGEPMNLALENIVDDGTIQVFDMQGRLLWQDIIRSSPQQIPTHYLVPGIYLIRVVREGGIEWTGKCAIL
jgi:hypothetical protein